MTYLSNLALQTLDINGCKLITDESFAGLLDVRTSRCAQNIETLLCSFLHNPTRVTSNFLLDLPNLRMIEMRMTAVCPSVAKILASKLHMAIFSHTDQLEHQRTPDVYYSYGADNVMMDHLSWPYWLLCSRKYYETSCTLSISWSLHVEVESEREASWSVILIIGSRDIF